jgi:hypothetical protein
MDKSVKDIIDEINGKKELPKLYFCSFDTQRIKIIQNRNIFNCLYHEFAKNDTTMIFTMRAKIPFGVELYSNRYILNLELFNKDKNNDVNNMYVQLKKLDIFMRSLSNISEFPEEFQLPKYIPNYVLDKFVYKNYIPCVRDRKDYDPHLRTHLKYSKNKVTTIFEKTTDNYLPDIWDASKIKGKMGTFDLHIAFLWFTQTDYGLKIIVDRAVIDKSHI